MIVEGRADITVVLVGYNSALHLENCLASLFRTEWTTYTASVVYVDNASSDASLHLVQRFDPRIKVIANAHNVGFSGACNQAVAASDSRYVFLLNNDTTLFPDSIPLLARYLDGHPKAGAAGSRLLNPDGSDQWSARRFPVGINGLLGRKSLLTKLFPNAGTVRRYLYKDEMKSAEPFPVDWIPGSCTLVRRDSYEQVGGLPPDMHYWSDAVFCDRLRKAKWEVHTVPRSRLIHHEGQGSGHTDRHLRKWLIEDFHRGAFRFYCEHFELSSGSPVRWLALGGLQLRARILIATASFAVAENVRSRVPEQ